jgi:hypothetical protein
VVAGLALLLAPGALADVTEFPLPHAESHPCTIVPGPDGNLWFTESDRGTIGRITPGGTITEFPALEPLPRRTCCPAHRIGPTRPCDRTAPRPGTVKRAGFPVKLVISRR